MMKINENGDLVRGLQLLTGVHRVHHIEFGYGWVFILLPFVGFFPLYARRWHSIAVRWMSLRHYHNCTWTGVY